MKKITKILAAFAAVCAISGTVALAEGSKDLNDVKNLPADNTTVHNGLGEEVAFDSTNKHFNSRAYLSNGVNLNGVGYRRTVIYACIKRGETVYFGSSVKQTSKNSVMTALCSNDQRYPKNYEATKKKVEAQGYTGATVAVTAPDAGYSKTAYNPSEDSILYWGDSNKVTQWDYNNNNTEKLTGVYMYAPDSEKNRGVIHNYEEEQAGPRIEGLNEVGYEPFSFTADYSGVYSFRFLTERYETEGVNGTYDTSLSADAHVTPCTINTIQGDWNEIVTGDNVQHKNVISTYQGYSNIAAWDITVVGPKDYKDIEDPNAEKEIKSGRVFTNVLSLNGGMHDCSLYGHMYTLTYDGFLYKISFNGMAANTFKLYSNKRGLLETTIRGDNVESKPYMHSLYVPTYGDGTVGAAPTPKPMLDSYGKPMKDKDGNVIYSGVDFNLNLNPPNDDPLNDAANRLFFNEPTTDDGIRVFTHKAKLAATYADIDNEMPKISYTGYNSDNNSSLCGTGGTFKISFDEATYNKLHYPKTLSIELDFSDYKLEEKVNADGGKTYTPVKTADGAWVKIGANEQKSEAERNNKKKINYVVHKGDNEITWDGYDSYGNIVPKGEYESLATAKWESGSVHFPFFDLGVNPNGIILERCNSISKEESGVEEDFDKNKYTLCYNNSGYPTMDGNDKYFVATAGIVGNRYPTRIGDGKNASGGVDSRNGAMQYYIYEGKDAGLWHEANGSPVGYLVPSYINYLGGPYDKTKEQKMFNSGFGYGHGAAIDMWSNFVGESSSKATVVVTDDKKDGVSPAIVSFVSQNPDVVLDPYDTYANHKTHVMKYGEEPVISPDHLGNNELGNTVSTGFVSSVVDSSIDVSNYNTVVWSVTIPMNDMPYSWTDADGNTVSDTAKHSYIKIDDKDIGYATFSGDDTEEMMVSIADLFGDDAFMQDVSLGAEGEIEEIGTDENLPELTAVSLYSDYEMYQTFDPWSVELKLMKPPVLEDDGVSVHSGKIYQISAISYKNEVQFIPRVYKLKLDFKYKIDPKYLGSGRRAEYGIILDDIYAPNAYAKVAYYRENNVIDNAPANDYSDKTYNALNTDKYIYPPRNTSTAE